MNKILIIILNKYKDFVVDFLLNLVAQFLKYTRINNYIIKLINNKQLY